jgi:hypothetical protein
MLARSCATGALRLRWTDRRVVGPVQVRASSRSQNTDGGYESKYTASDAGYAKDPWLEGKEVSKELLAGVG